MADRVDLADPTFEPSDEDLIELSHQAFSEVPARNRESLRRLNEEIERTRAEVLRRLGETS